MLTLAIDTSGKVASVAVADGERLLAEKILYTRLTHSQIILPMVQELLEDCSLGFGDLDAVVCAAGPGSYTGLRIGIAAVKGIVMGAPHLKCAAVSTLEALAFGCSAFQGRIVPVMYARPKIVYAGEYESRGGRVTALSADRVTDEAEFFAALDVSGPVMLTGDRCPEIKELYFAGNDNVLVSPFADRLQRASALCAAFAADPGRAVPAEALEASYLQATRAEKDKAHRDQ
ncbi:MAG: tRNA (adenosine(37)-N6)-threonylcarbamoyltransferase complex dimerization subunit type 1 TsaB [Ruminococcus sp.]|nr:tRNA (adenosine(37)-N6)-threonylcarbamoyltransferase complex dimerization subunit type 1 TsaB [Ruminococcus sp.]